MDGGAAAIRLGAIQIYFKASITRLGEEGDSPSHIRKGIERYIEQNRWPLRARKPGGLAQPDQLTREEGGEGGGEREARYGLA